MKKVIFLWLFVLSSQASEKGIDSSVAPVEVAMAAHEKKLQEYKAKWDEYFAKVVDKESVELVRHSSQLQRYLFDTENDEEIAYDVARTNRYSELHDLETLGRSSVKSRAKYIKGDQ